MKKDFHLTSGSEVRAGISPREQLQQQKKAAREMEPEIVATAVREGLQGAADSFGISETSVAKLCVKALKKTTDFTAEDLVSSEKLSEMEQLILSINSTSIKRMTTAAQGRFTEGELRIAKAYLTMKGQSEWEF